MTEAIRIEKEALDLEKIREYTSSHSLSLDDISEVWVEKYSQDVWISITIKFHDRQKTNLLLRVNDLQFLENPPKEKEILSRFF